MDLRYAWEKLFATVETLAGSTGTVQERLRDARASQLHRLVHPPDFLPDDLRPELQALDKELSSGRQWTDLEARDLAERIVSLFDQVARRRGPSAC